MVKLFCLPYAGGGASVYSKWKSYTNDFLEVVPIELAGRGNRMGETLYQSIEEAVADILHAIQREIHSHPYAFFGHSMGAIFAYEVAQKIRSKGLHLPLHLFFSGRGAPNIKPEAEKKYFLLNDEDFKSKVIALGGTPESFFEHPELQDIFLPILRNDFKLSYTDFSERKIQAFASDITVFLGKEEEITAEQVVNWKCHTHGSCHLHYFNGNHFFLEEYVDDIMKIITSRLTTAMHREKSYR